MLKLFEARWSWINTVPILGFNCEDSSAEWLEWITDIIFRTCKSLNHDCDSDLISCRWLINWDLNLVSFCRHLGSILLMLKRTVMNWYLTICSCPPACKLFQTKFIFSFMDCYICWLFTVHYHIWNWLKQSLVRKQGSIIRCDCESIVVLVNFCE